MDTYSSSTLHILCCKISACYSSWNFHLKLKADTHFKAHDLHFIQLHKTKHLISGWLLPENFSLR